MKPILSLLSVLILAGCGLESNQDSKTTAPEKKVVASESIDITDISKFDYASVPANAEYVLMAASDANVVGDYKHKALVLLKNYVEEKSNGRLAIKIFPSGQVAKTLNERLGGVISGSIDISHTVTDAFSYWEPIGIFDLPYLFENDRIAEAVMSDPHFLSEFRQGALEATKTARLMAITNNGGWRSFTTLSKPVETVDDLQGLKIRTIPSQVQQKLTTELGAAATPIPFSDLYTAMYTGVVDGTKLSLPDLILTKLHEISKNIVLDNHSYMTGFWWMNENKFQSLPKDMQLVLVDGFESMSWFLREFLKYEQGFSKVIYEQSGGKIYQPVPEELKAFHKKAEPVYEWYKQSVTPETQVWLEKINTIIDEKQTLIHEVRMMEIN